MCLCVAAVMFWLTVHFVFGQLRPNEQRAMWARIMDMALHKSAFLVLLAEGTLEGGVAWCAWFVITGTITLSSALGRDRFEWVRGARLVTRAPLRAPTPGPSRRRVATVATCS